MYFNICNGVAATGRWWRDVTSLYSLVRVPFWWGCYFCRSIVDRYFCSSMDGGENEM